MLAEGLHVRRRSDVRVELLAKDHEPAAQEEPEQGAQNEVPLRVRGNGPPRNAGAADSIRKADLLFDGHPRLLKLPIDEAVGLLQRLLPALQVGQLERLGRQVLELRAVLFDLAVDGIDLRLKAVHFDLLLGNLALELHDVREAPLPPAFLSTASAGADASGRERLLDVGVGQRVGLPL